MPFSTQSEFEHSRKAARRERNPRNAVMKGGDKSIGEEKHSQTVSRKARSQKEQAQCCWQERIAKKGSCRKRKIDRQIVPN